MPSRTDKQEQKDISPNLVKALFAGPVEEFPTCGFTKPCNDLASCSPRDSEMRAAPITIDDLLNEHFLEGGRPRHAHWF